MLVSNWFDDEPCPQCGGVMVAYDRGVNCTECDYSAVWSEYREDVRRGGDNWRKQATDEIDVLDNPTGCDGR